MQLDSDQLRDTLWETLKKEFLLHSHGSTTIAPYFVEHMLKKVLHREQKSDQEYIISNSFALKADGGNTVTFDDFATYVLNKQFAELALQKSVSSNNYFSRKVISEGEFHRLIGSACRFLEVVVGRHTSSGIFREIDRNRDKLISIDEYLGFVQNTLCRPSLEPEKANSLVASTSCWSSTSRIYKNPSLTNSTRLTESTYTRVYGSLSRVLLKPYHQRKTNPDIEGSLPVRSRFRRYIWSQMLNLFNEFDLKRGGRLDQSELNMLLKKVLKRHSDAERDYVFRNKFRLNTSRDGFLYFQDFTKFFLRHTAQIGLARFHRTQAPGKRNLTERQFVFLFKQSYYYLDAQQICPVFLGKIFQKIDLRHLMLITYSDYLNWIVEFVSVKVYKGTRYAIPEDDESAYLALKQQDTHTVQSHNSVRLIQGDQSTTWLNILKKHDSLADSSQPLSSHTNSATPSVFYGSSLPPQRVQRQEQSKVDPSLQKIMNKPKTNSILSKNIEYLQSNRATESAFKGIGIETYTPAYVPIHNTNTKTNPLAPSQSTEVDIKDTPRFNLPIPNWGKNVKEQVAMSAKLEQSGYTSTYLHDDSEKSAFGQENSAFASHIFTESPIKYLQSPLTERIIPGRMDLVPFDRSDSAPQIIQGLLDKLLVSLGVSRYSKTQQYCQVFELEDLLLEKLVKGSNHLSLKVQAVVRDKSRSPYAPVDSETFAKLLLSLQLGQMAILLQRQRQTPSSDKQGYTSQEVKCMLEECYSRLGLYGEHWDIHTLADQILRQSYSRDRVSAKEYLNSIVRLTQIEGIDTRIVCEGLRNSTYGSRVNQNSRSVSYPFSQTVDFRPQTKSSSILGLDESYILKGGSYIHAQPPQSAGYESKRIYQTGGFQMSSTVNPTLVDSRTERVLVQSCTSIHSTPRYYRPDVSESQTSQIRVMSSAKQQLRLRLQQYDASQKGYFEVSQIERLLRQIFGETNPEINYVVRNLFRANIDKQGRISIDSLCKFLLEFHCGELALQRMHMEQQISKGGVRSLAFSDFVDVLDYSLSFLGMEVDKELDNLANIFERLDKDSDGLISYSEYFKFVNKYLGQGTGSMQDSNQITRGRSLSRDQKLTISKRLDQSRSVRRDSSSLFSSRLTRSTATRKVVDGKKSMYDSIWKELRILFSSAAAGGFLQPQQLEQISKRVLKETTRKEINYVMWNLFRLYPNGQGKITFNQFARFMITHSAQMALQRFHSEQPAGKISLNRSEFGTVYARAFDFVNSVEPDDKVLDGIFDKIKEGNSALPYSRFVKWVEDEIVKHEVTI